jgi:hypothetical protein
MSVEKLRMLLVQQICKVLYSMHHTIYTRKKKSPHARRPTVLCYEIHQIKKKPSSCKSLKILDL